MNEFDEDDDKDCDPAEHVVELLLIILSLILLWAFVSGKLF